jgi:DNA excision repair protein ERCC-2
VSLRARDKVCLNEVVSCRPEDCRYAAGYHDKVTGGELQERAWSEAGCMDPVRIVDLGQQADACPYALSMELAHNADVVVGDYNYLFDPRVRLRSLLDEAHQWAIIVDEAHNLPQRAMGYGSPRLDRALPQAALESLGPDETMLPFARLAHDVSAWIDAGLEDVGLNENQTGEMALPLDLLDQRGLQALVQRADARALDYALLQARRSRLPPGTTDPYVELCRALHSLRSALDSAGDETVALFRRGRDDRGGLSLLCRDPSGLLGPILNSAAGTICMSATLQPPGFYGDLLGLRRDRTEEHQHPSPFEPSHLRVLVLPQVSTAYRHRSRDQAATAAWISRTVRTIPGNVAIYAPSFDFLEQLADQLKIEDRELIRQTRQVDEQRRAEILERMKAPSRRPAVLLAVLGGIFAEGIDLPGEALLAAIIIGPGLPPVGLERRLLTEWYEQRYGRGSLYASLVPGLCRVVQAAGRVIRTPTDRGAIVLVGKRFQQYEISDLMPSDWTPRTSRDPESDLAGLWSD